MSVVAVQNAKWRRENPDRHAFISAARRAHIANILPACRPCNARKGLTPLEVFKARLRKDAK